MYGRLLTRRIANGLFEPFLQNRQLISGKSSTRHDLAKTLLATTLVNSFQQSV
jgi:hypothetical protein